VVGLVASAAMGDLFMAFNGGFNGGFNWFL
jgi:hypothetical protein